MAIIKTITLGSGLVIDQAYVRVQCVNGNKYTASISLEIFTSKELCEQGKVPASCMSFTFTPMQEENAPRWDKQAYEYIKTLPEFAEAIDA